MPGPPPKRDDQRRRRNDPAAGPAEQAPGGDVVALDADPSWHRVAAHWYEALGRSGQSAFYESSDWALAYAVAESMSREFSKPEPVSASAFQGWLKAMTSLLVTEGDRRRLRLELERQGPAESEGGADVSELDEYRRRLQSG